MPLTARIVRSDNIGTIAILVVCLTTDIFVKTGLFVFLPAIPATRIDVTIDIIQNIVEPTLIVQFLQFGMTVKVDLILIFANLDRIQTTVRTGISRIFVTAVLQFITMERTVDILAELGKRKKDQVLVDYLTDVLRPIGV